MKKEIRKKVLAARDGLPQDQRAAKSKEIGERLFSLPEFTSARMILFFASFRSEVDTLPMIRRALRAGKRVVLPKVIGKELALFEIKDIDSDLAPGAWGIPEPVEARFIKIDDIDLIVTPGAAFDENGNRIGYGAGFYDKILPSYKGLTIALAFELQIVQRVPHEAHDVPVMKIVTEKRTITAQSAWREEQK